MIFPFRVINWQASLNRVRGMFNLNDSRWGRGPDDENKPNGNSNPNGEPHQSPNQQNPRNKGDQDQPDLDEVLRELQNRIGAMFGKAPKGPSNPNSSGGGSGPNPSRLRSFHFLIICTNKSYQIYVRDIVQNSYWFRSIS